jgi:hypothetical protein
VIGASKVGPRVRELTKGRVQIEFNELVHKIYGLSARDLMPIQVAIAEMELVETNFSRLPRSTVWQRR